MTAVILAAEARCRQSTMTINSIRLSLHGVQVGWMIKTSLPRTFSIISTLTSPSLKRPTWASPKSIRKRSATRLAKTGCALPVKIFNSATVYVRLRLGKWLGWRDSNPRMQGSKPCALPTWRHPNSKHSPMIPNCRFRINFKLFHSKTERPGSRSVFPA